MQWIFDSIPGRLLLALIGTAMLLPLGFFPEPKIKHPPAAPPMIHYLGETPTAR